MKIIFFTLFITICCIINAQNIEVTYHTDFARNAARPDKIKSEQTKLIIKDGVSEFYSSFKGAIDSLLEVMEKKGASYNEYVSAKSGMPPGQIAFRIYKNYPQKGQLTFTDDINSTYYKYTEPLKKPQWKIETETKEIIGYKCQKATTTFRGRTWMVWFTKDIPIQDGPWKLWALPGLILEAEDNASLYRFVAIGLKKGESKSIGVRNKRYINCSRSEYMKQKEIFERNPLAAISKDAGGIEISDGKGGVIKSKDGEYIDIEIN